MTARGIPFGNEIILQKLFSTTAGNESIHKGVAPFVVYMRV
jgi:hypothetical protein